MEVIRYLNALSENTQFHLNVYSLIVDGSEPDAAVSVAAANFGLTGNIPKFPENVDLLNIDMYISMINIVNDRLREITDDPSVERALREYCNDHRIVPQTQWELDFEDSDWYSILGTTMDAAIIHVRNTQGNPTLKSERESILQFSN